MGGSPTVDPSGPLPTLAPSDRRPVIVKLGGSVITRKREIERIRPKNLARLAREVASGRPGLEILLHGAGSFGHPGATRWGLARPPDPSAHPRDRIRGAAIVQAEVRRLHAKVLAALLEAGANPISVPCATHSENRAGRLARFDPAPFRYALEAGALPVSFGDVVPDSEWGFSILSADTIALALVRAIGAARVLFVSDVPGILRTPGRGQAIYPELSSDVVGGISATARAPDVTGGIVAKANVMLEIAELGVDAGLISGLSDGAVSRAIRGEAVYGSWAKAASQGSDRRGRPADERARSLPS